MYDKVKNTYQGIDSEKDSQRQKAEDEQGNKAESDYKGHEQRRSGSSRKHCEALQKRIQQKGNNRSRFQQKYRLQAGPRKSRPGIKESLHGGKKLRSVGPAL